MMQQTGGLPVFIMKKGWKWTVPPFSGTVLGIHLIGFVMKRIVLAFMFLACVATLTYGRKVAEGLSNSSLGKYTIEALDEPFTLAGEEMKCYKITYENSPLTVKVIVDKEKKCRNFLVISDKLSVMYTCNGQYFGVNKVDKKYATAGFATDDKALERADYFHQKLIVRGLTSEIDAARLIASYYPYLIKGLEG